MSPIARRIRRVLVWSVSLAALFVIGATAYEVGSAQRADYGWSPKVPAPWFANEHPVAVIDEAHNNASTGPFWGRYWPLARLLRADGWNVERGLERFSPSSLSTARVVIVANASGQRKPQAFGINLPVERTGNRGDNAFTGSEIAAIRAWVANGGSLLLIADHAPFGDASASLAAAFGVTFHKGFLEVKGESSDPLLFSNDTGRLGEHPIITGGGKGARVQRVMTYTGQSIDGPAGSSILLRVPRNAFEEVAKGNGFETQPPGQAQGVAFNYGRGRVVVLGEAAMMTAQVSKWKPFGMNTPDNDNALFALNVMRWLGGRL